MSLTCRRPKNFTKRRSFRTLIGHPAIPNWCSHITRRCKYTQFAFSKSLFRSKPNGLCRITRRLYWIQWRKSVQWWHKCSWQKELDVGITRMKLHTHFFSLLSIPAIISYLEYVYDIRSWRHGKAVELWTLGKVERSDGIRGQYVRL